MELLLVLGVPVAGGILLATLLACAALLEQLGSQGGGMARLGARLRDALEASGAEMVTVALRRADLSGKKDPFANILEFLNPEKFFLLPEVSRGGDNLRIILLHQPFDHDGSIKASGVCDNDLCFHYFPSISLSL